ncbi:biotin transporter BioY [Nonomuraea monospora]|uniref:Biotin transporter n=1 Tax=Nonomuraea monospora TaxID=568818 RepID=A0ABN3CG87_9ACTN
MKKQRGIATQTLARVAVFAALIAVLGVPGTLNVFGAAVPITLQTMGVMLAGVILGTWRAALAVLVLLVLIAAGLPLAAGGRGGLGLFTGPSAGFLIGWLPGAAVTGWLTERAGRSPSTLQLFVACLVGCIGVIYLFGIPVWSLVGGIPLGTAALSTLLFLPGDLLKAGLTAVVARGTQRAYPDAVPAVHRERVRSGWGR